MTGVLAIVNLLLPKWLLLALLAGALAHGCNTARQRDVARVTLADLRTSVATERADRADVARNAALAFRNQERRDAERAMEIERDLQAQASAAAAAAARAAAAGDGLRGTIDTLNAAARGAGLPTAAACPAELAAERQRAITARELLGSCTAEYRGLAAEADGIALKLDGALAWIDQVQAPAPTP